MVCWRQLYRNRFAPALGKSGKNQKSLQDEQHESDQCSIATPGDNFFAKIRRGNFSELEWNRARNSKLRKTVQTSKYRQDVLQDVNANPAAKCGLPASHANADLFR